MTLVAAFKIESVPVLVGDLLITEGPGTSPHNFLPTRPDLTTTSSEERRRSGVRRKVLLLGRGKLIVGFTGTVEAGAILFKDLARRFSDDVPSPEDLTFAFQLFNIHLWRRATVVGWLADPEPRCFTWSARPGSQVDWVTHAILGSGADHFARIILSADNAGHSDNFTPTELARYVAITKATTVLGNELSAAGTLQNNYGYCLEVATWNGTHFEFVDTLTFSFYNALIGPGDRNQIQPVMLRIYNHQDRFSIVQTTILADTIGPDGSLGPHVYVDMATGLHDDCNDVTLPHTTLDPHAQIYCFGIAWRDQQSQATGFFNLTVEASEVEIQGDKQKFGLQLRDSKAMFATLREFISSRQMNAKP
jgi:hypothetical protein